MVNTFNGNFHYVSTRNLSNGFKKESSFKIKRENYNNEDMILVYECRVGGPKSEHSFISHDYNCENTFNMGPMGYLYKEKSLDICLELRDFNAWQIPFKLFKFRF